MSSDTNEALYPLIAVVGPTASGKSSLALDIAERFGGEIVNFDSVQVYRRFEIGTAKTPVAERRGIPHHLIDIVEPDALFTAGEYAEHARVVVDEIRARSRLPVFVGGTGLYLRALLNGLFQGPKRDELLRERLEERVASKPAGYLHRLLTRLDPVNAERIHPNDTPKLMRSIEVSLLAGAPISTLWKEGKGPLEGFKVTRVGLNPPRSALYARINRRTKQMFKTGLADEAKDLLASGTPRSARPFGSLGYAQALDYLDGNLTLDEAIESASKMTRRYAKRQMTWFRREPDVEWFAGFGDDPTVRGEVLAYLEGVVRAAPKTI